MESAIVDNSASSIITDMSRIKDKLVTSNEESCLAKIDNCVDNSGTACKKGLEDNFDKFINNLSDSSSTGSELERKKKFIDDLICKTSTKEDSEVCLKTSLGRIGGVKNNSTTTDDGVSGRENLPNVADDSVNVSIQNKRGRKKKSLYLPERSIGVITNKEVHSNSPCDLLVTKSNMENLISNIKSEPVEDETLHMSCDEVDASSEISRRTSADIPVVKRGRGRPRKVPSSIYDHTSNRNKTDSYKLQNIKTKAKGNDEVNSRSSSTSSEHHRGVVKRGRGRPRKSDSSVPVTVGSLGLPERNSSESRSFPLVRRSTYNSGSKRRIVKPKRFEPYESFDFMEVIDRNTFSSNDTSQEDRDDDSDELHIVEVEEERGEEEGGNQNQDEEDGDTKPIQKKPRVGKKRKKLSLLPSALGLEEENEFDAFGRNVALQLKSLPLQDALELQIEILSLISQRRL